MSMEEARMGNVGRIVAGVIGTALAAAVAFAQAQQPAPAGRTGAPAAQTPAGQQPAGRQGGQPAQQDQGGGRGGRGGRGGGGGGAATQMGFFVTSVGKGDGANLGGLAGADAHCAALAKASGAAGAATRMWRAYLSTTAANGQPAVNARDRIGPGPWYNSKGTLIANNVADLHGDIERDRNQITKANALTEKGDVVNGFGDMPNTHDMLTGSDSHGRAVAGTLDTTCSNWTSNAAPPAGAPTGANAPNNSGPGANVGHHDRTGGGNTSWNFAHRSRGCSQDNLVATGGAGLFYCFAAN
jgi:hypothetical protein